LSKRRTTPAPSQYDPGAPRQSRREQLRDRRKRRSFLWNAIILGTLAVFGILIAFYVFNIQRPGPLPGETQVPIESEAVVPAGSEPTYQHFPPTSGDRYEQPAGWGVSAEAVSEPAYLANLARGGVVYLYDCPDGCPELVAQFQDLVSRAKRDTRLNQPKILVSPYPRGLDTQIVALAWGYEMAVDTFDYDRLMDWYDRFLNQEGPARGQ
jgi:hypothetical protein